MNVQIDTADRIILSHMQEDATISLEQLSLACNLSVASVQRRLKRLRTNKVIERECAIVNPEALDFNMMFVITVELERERLDQLDEFRRITRTESQVQQCYYVTGEADFVLICIAKNMADFEELTHRLFFENSNVRRFRTSVVMDRSKSGSLIPTDE